jgi:hypothetical protein
MAWPVDASTDVPRELKDVVAEEVSAVTRIATVGSDEPALKG